jgi:hypothetical protein
MIDSERDPIIERIAREARRPVAVEPDAKARLLAVIRAEGAPGSFEADTAEFQLYQPQRPGVTLSAWRLGALAAGLVGVGILSGLAINAGRDSRKTGQPPGVVAIDGSSRLPASNATDTVMTFVFVTHDASKVALVGDFNQWNADATPMKRIANSNAWTVTLPLSVGRHVYSFYAVGADGEKWLTDPNAPATPDDGFGRRNSVVLVPSKRGPAS